MRPETGSTKAFHFTVFARTTTVQRWRRRSRLSELESDAENRSAERELVERLLTMEVVREVAIAERHVAPRESVADAAKRLPGEVGRAAAYIDIIGQIPTIREIGSSAQTYDAIPNVLRDLRVPLRRHAAKRSGELPFKSRLDPQITRASDEIDIGCRRLHQRITAFKGAGKPF